MKFVKKPVIIEAMQWLGPRISTVQYFLDFDEWLISQSSVNELQSSIKYSGDKLLIDTLEGQMTASPGDWIIIGVNGEIYPCKPDIFEKTYAAVEDNNA